MKLIITEQNITIYKNKRPLNVSRSIMPETYQKIKQLQALEQFDEIENMYEDIKLQIENYTKDKITTGKFDNVLIDKQTGEEIPKVIAIQLGRMKENENEFTPLLRFWNKLKRNPDQAVKEQLYNYVTQWNIPINEYGDLVCEKGVIYKDGKLVDCYTKTIDNSIGITVRMPREDVEANPDVACSNGLHVGAPTYVRDNYATSWAANRIIIVCTVNPEYVVSIPRDCSYSKMRVCEYTSAGYSEKDSQDKPVVSLSDICNFEPVDRPTKATEKAAAKAHKRSKKAGAIDLSKRFYVEIGKGQDSYKAIKTADRLCDATRMYNAIKLLEGRKKRLTDKQTGKKIKLDIKRS
tara:strand:- start:4501 stop:5550 length:1050 start_codon:yes stop_codon:yes gene_type:complete